MDVSAYVAKHDAQERAGETIEARSEHSIGPAGVVVTASDESSASGHPRASESSRSPDGAALTDSPEPHDAGSEETEPNPGEGA
jgi:hypothetical protein